MNTTQDSTLEQLTFSGTAGEYFRIWIVNVCLTVITLGIYSPWAKVRRMKYLYRSTHLAGGSFDYHASPVAILISRCISVAVLAVYVAVANIAPGWDGLILLIILLHPCPRPTSSSSSSPK